VITTLTFEKKCQIIDKGRTVRTKRMNCYRFGNAGPLSAQAEYGYLLQTKPTYTVSQVPLWPNLQEYPSITRVTDPVGSYEVYPWASLHTRSISAAMQYK
jgi:hypothetical protein